MPESAIIAGGRSIRVAHTAAEVRQIVAETPNENGRRVAEFDAAPGQPPVTYNPYGVTAEIAGRVILDVDVIEALA